MTERIHNAVES